MYNRLEPRMLAARWASAEWLVRAQLRTVLSLGPSPSREDQMTALHRAPRLHHAARRLCGSVAACGASAAANAAGGGFVRDGTFDVSDDRVTAFRQSLKEAAPKRRDRVPFGSNWQVAACADGPSSPAGSSDRRKYHFGAGGQGRNHDSADRLCDRRRPGQRWLRPWWQRHRYQHHVGGACGETAWALA
jgi:hypothetical protein